MRSNHSEFYRKRNLRIVEDRSRGMKVRDLAEMHGISPHRVYQIWHKEQRRQRYEAGKAERDAARAERQRTGAPSPPMLQPRFRPANSKGETP